MKRCPYCAEEIHDEAIVCKYCGHDLKIVTKKNNPNPVIVIFMSLLVIILCIANEYLKSGSLNQGNDSSKPTEAGLDLCDWFLGTQLIRASRISNASEFMVWIEQNSGSSELSEEEFNHFKSILERQIVINDQFIKDWLKLGSHAEAEAFWRDELLSVQLRSEAFKKMLNGLNNQNADEFDSGFANWEQSAEIGMDAENAMKLIQNICINKSK